jgi:beta-lactamase class A
MKKAIFLIVSTSFLLSSCSLVNNRVSEFQEKVQQFQEPKIEDKELIELEGRIGKIAAEAKGRVGVSAVVLETGESVSFEPSGQFPMQSVYKLPIAMAVLKQVEEGKLKLDQKVRVEKTEYVRAGMHSPLRDKNPNGAEVTVRELIRLSVAESDGTTSDVLMRLAGGAASIQNYLTGINIGEVIVANPEREIGQDWETQYRNWASPEGATALLRALHEQRGISRENRELLLKFMIESGPGAKRLRGLLPAGTVVAHKTGTSGTNKDGITAATNDIGIFTLPNGKHIAIAVFVSDSPADEAMRESVIARIAKEAWDAWSKPDPPKHA